MSTFYALYLSFHYHLFASQLLHHPCSSLVGRWHEKDAQASRASGALTQDGASKSNIGSGPLDLMSSRLQPDMLSLASSRYITTSAAAAAAAADTASTFLQAGDLQQLGLALHKDRP